MLSRLLGAIYENRGKRSVNEVGARAEQLGLRRVLFLYEAKGNPARIAFWEDGWLEPELAIYRVRGADEKGPRVPSVESKVLTEGPDGEKLKELLDLSEPEGSRFIEVRASSKGLHFFYNEFELLALEGGLVAAPNERRE